MIIVNSLITGYCTVSNVYLNGANKLKLVDSVQQIRKKWKQGRRAKHGRPHLSSGYVVHFDN